MLELLQTVDRNKILSQDANARPILDVLVDSLRVREPRR